MKEYIIDDGRGTRAAILPEKGATVVGLARDGVEFLYRDQENLESAERPRCGIPFLFPIFGRLKDGVYTWDGETYTMEIHGFGHTSVWEVVEAKPDELTLELTANESTLAQYPFRFRAVLHFQVEDGTLTIGQRFENLGEKPMPYNYGFHPYFLVEELSHAQVETTAKTYFDFTVGKPAPFGHSSAGISLPDGAPETGGVFFDADGPTTLHISEEGRTIMMNHGAEYPQIVLWHPAGKRFLCVEPNNGTANGLNTGVYRTLAPGEVKEATLTIHIEHS